MKNLKKLAKSELKKINGGNAPVCEPGARPCRYKAENGYPAYWSCVAEEYAC
ncbi:bacteriocin-like protein [Chryseobacterium jejuense]|uniref:bacteriocin-like protein n=1 Tax=Chryseobacterium jejuense TaxID=445960 RepID=UPI001AE1419F|nr:hypothetical protein [Chryseobacterium jejuense]MBP2616716.1 hypothetical protein [Chryseobacterium jejuense]